MHDFGSSGTPFPWDEEWRFLLYSNMDAPFFHLYLPTEDIGGWRLSEGEAAEALQCLMASFSTLRDAMAYTIDTFPIVRRKDEEKVNGDYRTRRLILESTTPWRKPSPSASSTRPASIRRWTIRASAARRDCDDAA